MERMTQECAQSGVYTFNLDFFLSGILPTLFCLALMLLANENPSGANNDPSLTDHYLHATPVHSPHCAGEVCVLYR
jgi:hypothetical protein